LVYIACAAAASAGVICGGVATMLAFGLGTAPMPLLIGLAGKAVLRGNPLRLRRQKMSAKRHSGQFLHFNILMIWTHGDLRLTNAFVPGGHRHPWSNSSKSFLLSLLP
jgi:sulfite exporter TauE/SafE